MLPALPSLRRITLRLKAFGRRAASRTNGRRVAADIREHWGNSGVTEGSNTSAGSAPHIVWRIASAGERAPGEYGGFPPSSERLEGIVHEHTLCVRPRENDSDEQEESDALELRQHGHYASGKFCVPERTIANEQRFRASEKPVALCQLQQCQCARGYLLKPK